MDTVNSQLNITTKKIIGSFSGAPKWLTIGRYLTVELTIIHIQNNSCKHICKQHLYIYENNIYKLYTAYIHKIYIHKILLLLLILLAVCSY